MTDRERLHAIMDGRAPDRIPGIPRMLIWYTARTKTGTLPERFRGMSLREVERALRLGTPAREGRVFREGVEGVEMASYRVDVDMVQEFRTPVGSVTSRVRHSEELARVGIQGMEVEHVIKGPDDYRVVEYMLEHTRYEACYDDYLRYEAEIGEDGVPLVAAGDCPFHHFLQKLAGYQTGYYHLYDYPDKVGRLFGLMQERGREVWDIVVKSPARLFLHGVHFDSAMTSPPMFKKYITPYYLEFSDLLHRHGKVLCMHADADSRLILENIRESGFDMAETFTTDPMVDCTLEEARAAWGNEVIIWGGVPSIILEPTFSEEEFEAYMKRVFRAVAPGDAFILGVADNVMPAAMVERIERITEMVETWGWYPIKT
jgi:uroporphyrinogen-III decarboxylase